MVQILSRSGPAKAAREAWRREVLDELGGMKKTLRRQTLLLESFKKETREALAARNFNDLKPLWEFTESFFHLDSSLREMAGLSANQLQAMEIAWEKLEGVLAAAGLEVIRRAGEPFDPRRHEGVERISASGGNPVVSKILQPGFLCSGQVIRPARVMLDAASSTQGVWHDE
ncbi:MAG: nucleotide exchange factor GrpE [Deltaproteobacteria bacterium]|nr:nucleotide exchange factor GrpE [Deltaproteobacteria bacterium]